MLTMKSFIFLFIIRGTCTIQLSGQAIAREGTPEDLKFKEQYAINIKLSKINGVYIPANLNEAFSRLQKLSPPQSILKFRMAEELVVCEKLHFGIGRWMIVNWNFYQGSRISHLLKTKGLKHPDDMAQFLLRTFHRHLNGKTLNEEELIEKLSDSRATKTKSLLGIE